jgi:hypothetical protein
VISVPEFEDRIRNESQTHTGKWNIKLQDIISILPVSSPFNQETIGDDGKMGVKRSLRRFSFQISIKDDDMMSRRNGLSPHAWLVVNPPGSDYCAPLFTCPLSDGFEDTIA